MTKQALILAAGRGRPVGEPDVPNCLATVGGVPLVLRWMRVLARAGVRRVAFVLGWQGDPLRRRIEELHAGEPALSNQAASTRLDLSFFDNAAWDGPNGLSVLAARPFLHERTLLVMADQICAPALVTEMVAAPAVGATTLLAVDRDLSRVFDFDDATKAALGTGNEASCVRALSKTLVKHDAVSAGLFVMAPSLLDSLDALPLPSLTQGVAHAAERGLVRAHDVRGALWQDVDSPEMRLHAEWLLRVYGDDLARPAVVAAPRAQDTDTMALVERLLAEKDEPRFTLFNPGPVMTSARVKAALVHHDVCHRDADYSDVVRRLQAKLRPIFGASDQHDMLLLTGSGTAAMEMAISSSVPAGKAILTIDNGAFGERLGEIARVHGFVHHELRYPWGALPSPADVEAMLDRHPDIAVVTMIHHETSVGVLNPVGAVGAVCRARDVLLVVDAVSSLGAEDIDVIRDHIDLCYSSANKCLHSVSGVSFLCVSPRVWPRIEAIPPRVLYLDMKRYRRYLQQLDQTPFTPAVSAFFALETAIDELMESGGVPARREVYRLRNLRVRRVLADLGFQSFSNTGRESHVICTLRVPVGVTVDALYDHMKDRGFIIYRCKGDLAREHIQIATMGELPDATIDAFLAATADVVATLRRQVPAH